MGKKKPLFEVYVEGLVEKLGPHYKYEHYGEQWIGFIYCECYYGKNFFAWPPEWAASRLESKKQKNVDYLEPNPPMLIPGAVARVESAKVIILDLSQDHYKNQDPRPHSKNRNSDAIIIEAAEPNFDEKFMKIIAMHDKNTEYFGVKNVYGRSDGVR